MDDNYAKIVHDNLNRLYENLPQDLAQSLPGIRKGDRFIFNAFGEECQIQPDRITLGGIPQTGALGILISLYALHARLEPCQLEPLKAYREFPHSMPYTGAFVTRTEQILVPHVPSIETHVKRILETFRGQDASPIVKGDFSFFVRPLPKITLCYIFYRADDEFPASVTCLFSHNAFVFLPIDALADIGEYTSRKILNLLEEAAL